MASIDCTSGVRLTEQNGPAVTWSYAWECSVHISAWIPANMTEDFRCFFSHFKGIVRPRQRLAKYSAIRHTGNHLGIRCNTVRMPRASWSLFPIYNSNFWFSTIGHQAGTLLCCTLQSSLSFRSPGSHSLPRLRTALAWAVSLRLPPRGPGFDPRLVHAGFLVD
jgi:hypothetical protein